VIRKGKQFSCLVFGWIKKFLKYCTLQLKRASKSVKIVLNRRKQKAVIKRKVMREKKAQKKLARQKKVQQKSARQKKKIRGKKKTDKT
jgi:hypothetical protein